MNHTAAELDAEEVSAIVARLQPESVAVHADNQWGVVRLVRFWKNLKATEGCRLCPLCHAFKRKGKTVCVVLAPPTSTYADVNPLTIREQGTDGLVLTRERAEDEIAGGCLDSHEYKIDFARVRPTSRVDALMIARDRRDCRSRSRPERESHERGRR